MTQMNLKVKKVNQVNPKTQQMGYAARVLTNGTETFEDLVDYASHNTSIHRVEVNAAAELILEAAARALKNGKIVDLGPLGRIRPSVLSKWVTDPKKLTKADLTKSMTYSPSADIEAAIQSARLVWSNAADEEEEENGDGTTVVDDDSNNGNGGDDNQGGNDNQGGGTNSGDNNGGTNNGGGGNSGNNGGDNGDDGDDELDNS